MSNPNYDTVTVPLRDLTEEEVRDLIGDTVTVKVYATTEATEPDTIITARLAVVAFTETHNIIGFAETGLDPRPEPVETPVTVTYSRYVG